MDTLVQALEQNILKLWHEGMMLNMIARKLGIDQDKVEDIVEAPGNYLPYEALKNLMDF